jgi:CBS-domain-containing membrane protein
LEQEVRMQPTRRCTVYERHGNTRELAIPANEVVVTPQRRPTIADMVPLRAIMRREVVCARPDCAIEAVVALLVDAHIGCVPIVDERQHPIGMITKFDLVEQLDQSLRSGRPMTARTAEELMMPLALTLFDHASVAHAAAMMTSEDLHHVLVVATSGVLVGVVSTKDIVKWLVDNDGLFDGTAR